MCFQDWRIGRLIRAVPFTLSVANGSLMIIKANPIRVGLTFYNADGNLNLRVAPDVAPTVITDGFIIGDLAPFHMTLATHGDLPMHAWGVYNSAVAAQDVQWIEYYATEKGLRIGLDEFQRQYGGSV